MSNLALTSVLKGTFIIATVKGDVHDIGKNLVDIINACLAVEPEQIYLLAELYQCYFDNRDFADAIQVANQLKTSCQGLPSQAVADFIELPSEELLYVI